MGCLDDIYQSLEFIRENINTDITVEQCSKVACLSKSYYITAFKCYIGDTPQNYIKKLKLKQSAVELFKNKKIVDVAFDAGYQSQEAFTRAFKKEYGFSPFKFRNLKKNGLVPIQELNEIECAFLFHSQREYDEKKDFFIHHENIRKALIDKGYIDSESNVWTLEGMQLSNKYYYECASVMLQNFKQSKNNTEVYRLTNHVIPISKWLFYKFLYELYDNGFLVEQGVGCCGSNCFECETFRATIEDDRDLKHKILEDMRPVHPEIQEAEILCYGCKSDKRMITCETNCPWKQCCEQHKINRCNECMEYPCKEVFINSVT